MDEGSAPVERRSWRRGIPELILGALAVSVAVRLLALAEKALAGSSKAWLLGLLLVLAASLQALPALGILVFGRDRLVPDQRRPVSTGSRAGFMSAVRLVLIAFLLTYLGVFALLHSLAFMPIVTALLMGSIFLRHLVRRDRAWYGAWWALSVAATAAGMAALELSRRHLG